MSDEEKDQETQAEDSAQGEQGSAPAAESSEAAPAAAVEAPVKKEAPAKASEASEAPPVEEDGREKKKDERRDVFAELDPEGEEKPKILKAKGSKNVYVGIVHVLATFNNTIVSITDRNGNVIGWASSGKMGFKGSRKSTAYAAQLVAQDACKQAMGHGLREAEVRVKGPGSGRESAVRAVQAIGIDITAIKDVTPVPHNGCRPPKARRV